MFALSLEGSSLTVAAARDYVAGMLIPVGQDVDSKRRPDKNTGLLCLKGPPRRENPPEQGH